MLGTLRFAQPTLLFTLHFSLNYKIIHQNKSACDPVRIRQSSLPSILYINNQSGSMWHSRQSFRSPFSWWSRCFCAIFSALTSSRMIFFSFSRSLPRFCRRFRSRLNWVSLLIDLTIRCRGRNISLYAKS